MCTNFLEKSRLMLPFIYFFMFLLLPGRSDPEISVTTQEGNAIPRRCSNPASHSSSPKMQKKHSPSSANTDNQGGRPPRSPHGHGGGLLRGQRQTWDGQPATGSGSQTNITLPSSQNHIGPVR